MLAGTLTEACPDATSSQDCHPHPSPLPKGERGQSGLTMPFLELSLIIRVEQQPHVEDALNDLGAQAITLQDADAETPDEQAIFEPGVGELPLWPTITLNALFDADTDRRGLTETLAELLPWLEPDQLTFRDVADENWERAWMDQYKPMAFGRRLWIYPWNIEPPADEDTVVVRLDPGLAFGSGTHPTTALCLEWLDGIDLAGKTLTDFGCGSGILAIAALKLGAASATGVDNDPQALTASADNAERNGVADRLALFLPDEMEAEPAEVFIANILAGPLGELAPTFAAAAKPNAPFAISGILIGQQDELLQRYGEWFDELRVDTREDWVRISGRRRA